MQCAEVRPLLELYADDELDVSRSLELEHHLETCSACAAQLKQVKALAHAVRDSGIYGSIPSGLSTRVRTAVLEEAGFREQVRVLPVPRPARLTWWRPLAIAAVAVIILAVFAVRWIPVAHRANDENTLVAQEVLDSHVRSMMADHLFDVPSTDQHTVKPWFDGKLDFAPPVIDLTSDGFELAGGRLDYIAGRPVAAVVYRRRKHVINLLMWPSDKAEKPTPLLRNGYNLLHWDNGAMQFWAVSDLNLDELRQFAQLIQKKAPPLLD